MTSVRFTVYAYAYATHNAITSGRFENGFRVSYLLDGKSPESRLVMTEALTRLEEDGYITVRKQKDKFYKRGPHPKCLFRGPKLTGGSHEK